MMKRILAVGLAACFGLLLLNAVSGCGEESQQQNSSLPATAPRTIVEQDPMQKSIDEMDHKAFTLEITGNGGAMSFLDQFSAPGSSPGAGNQAKYSQDGKGSWRIDYASESLIFNAGEKKVWFVKGKTAWEYSPKGQTSTQPPPYPDQEFRSPLSMIFTMAPPRTGPNAVKPKTAGTDGVWEWDLSQVSWETPLMGGMTSMGAAVAAPPPEGMSTVPSGVMVPPPPEGVTVPAGAAGVTASGEAVGTSTGTGQPSSALSITLRMEFNGPEGLLSRIVITNPGGTQEQIFNYTNVGDVPEDTFQLPAEVEEVRIPTDSNSSPFPYMFGAPGD